MRVLAPDSMIILIVDIHPRPTIAEPHALPWDLTQRFVGLRIIEELDLARPADGGYFGACEPFDHARAGTESGSPIAKLVKVARPTRCAAEVYS